MLGAATSAMLRCALRSGGAGDAAAAALPALLATSAPSACTSCSPACRSSAGYAPRQAAGIATTATSHQQQQGLGEAGHRPAASVDFGFKEVPRSDKQSMVEQVFTSVASSYDIMNDLMSGGMHRLWKDRLVETLRPFPGHQHLDVAGGTGDVAFRVLRAIRRAELEARMRGRPAARAAAPGAAAGASDTAAAADPPASGGVVVCDINPSMLAEGQRKAKAAPDLAGDTGLSFVEGNAESLPQFADAQFDSYTVAFGIRNVTDRGAALAEAYRVLRPGGRFLCLEFSHVTQPGLREVYDAYSFAVIPAIGQLVARDGASYQYLVESIRKFPDQEAFAGMIEDAGFSAVTYESLMGGIVAIHSGFKLP